MRLKLAFLAAWDSRDGDPGEHRRCIERFVDVHERLVAEQLAELGYLPSTVAGCVAVLEVAARILDLMAAGRQERRVA